MSADIVNKLEKYLDVSEYVATFEANLNKDHSAKQFWCKQIRVLILKFAEQALHSALEENGCADEEQQIAARVSQYREDYEDRVGDLLKNEDEFLSVRMLLEINEDLLTKHKLGDVWRREKEIENSKALELFPQRIEELDKIQNEDDRWHEIFRGILAGNVFDYGATQVQELLNNNKNFNLNDALSKIQTRPWLIDGFDAFVERLNGKPQLKCAVVFVDNSGMDVVLGILPFVRELLKVDMKVILCANSQPSINDITYIELLSVVKRMSALCTTIRDSLESKMLIVAESGQTGCCLNFLKLDEKLLDTMSENEVDLIVIEGMGRALHTNLNSKFKCDSTLKLAVIKNNYLASRLGGKLFDAICKFEQNIR